MKRRLLTVLACLLAGVIFVSWAYFHTVRQTQLGDRLIAAIRHNDLEQARTALQSGADGNASDRSDQKPPTLLAQIEHLFHPHRRVMAPSGDTALLLYLLGPYRAIHTSSGEVIVRDPDRTLADDPEFVRALLDAGADVHAARAETQTTALHLAAKRALPQITRLLLARGADPNAPDSHRRTPLYMAVLSGNQETMQILLDGGAKIDAQDDQNSTPLEYAIDSGRQESALLLIQRHADLNRQTSYGMSPLMTAILHGEYRIVRAMIPSHPDLNQCDHYGHTALDFAIASFGDPLPQMTPEMRERHGLVALLRHAGAKTGQELRSNAAGFHKARTP